MSAECAASIFRVMELCPGRSWSDMDIILSPFFYHLVYQTKSRGITFTYLVNIFYTAIHITHQHNPNKAYFSYILLLTFWNTCKDVISHLSFTVYAASTNNAQNIFISDVDRFWYLYTTISIMFLNILLTILTINKSNIGVSDNLILKCYGKYFINLMCHSDFCLCTFGI
jgi:hypothetical protein